MATKTKRKIRRFAEGGTDRYSPDQDVADAQAARDTSSFKDAFRQARKDGDKTFMWNGKRYTTDLAPTAKSSAKASESDTTATPSIRRGFSVDSPTMNSYRAAMLQPSGPSMSADTTAAIRARDAATTRGLANATMGPIAAAGTEGAVGTALGGLGAVRLARAAGMQEDAVAATNAAKRAAARKTDEEIARKVETASDRRTRKLAETMRQEKNRDRAANSPGIIDWRRAPSDADLSGVIGGYKRGGSIKKYAKGGSIRGGGIERKGKTKGRFV